MRGWGSGEGGKWRMIFFGFCSLLGHFLEWMLIGWHIKSENMRKKGECTQMCQNYLLKKGKRECHPNQLFFQSANPSIHFAQCTPKNFTLVIRLDFIKWTKKHGHLRIGGEFCCLGSNQNPSHHFRPILSSLCHDFGILVSTICSSLTDWGSKTMSNLWQIRKEKY